MSSAEEVFKSSFQLLAQQTDDGRALVYYGRQFWGRIWPVIHCLCYYLVNLKYTFVL